MRERSGPSKLKAKVFLLTGRKTEAASLAAGALDLLDSIERDVFPEDRAKAMANVAVLAANAGRPTEAEALFFESNRTRRGALGAESNLAGASWPATARCSPTAP